MLDPQMSRKFSSDDPGRDLEVDHAFGSPNIRDPLTGSDSTMSQLKNVLGAGALVQEIQQQRQQLAAMLLTGGSSGQPGVGSLNPASLGLGGLGSGLLGSVAAAAGRRASLPTALGLGPTAATKGGGSQPAGRTTPGRNGDASKASQNKLPISSFLANSSQSGGGVSGVARSEAV